MQRVRISRPEYYVLLWFGNATLGDLMRSRFSAIAVLMGLALPAGAQVRTKAPHTPESHPYPANTTYATPAWFVNVAPQAGLTMQNVNGDTRTKTYIIETTGSGVAIVDYDRDGWPDIYIHTATPLDGHPKPAAPPTNHL